MLPRLALAALLILAATAPSAHAAAFPIVPVRDAADGVRASVSSKGLTIRFAPEAARDYRRLAGRRIDIECTNVPVPEPGRFPGISSSTGEQVDAPARRRTLRASVRSDSDYCLVLTKLNSRADCVEAQGVGSEGCLRMVLAFSDEARTHVDEISRSYDLLSMSSLGSPGDTLEDLREELPPRFRDKLVPLPGPEDAPPPDTVGFWSDGTTVVLATVTAAGVRRYLRGGGGELATNAYGLLDIAVPDFV